jgi:hypothetical protein
MIRLSQPPIKHLFLFQNDVWNIEDKIKKSGESGNPAQGAHNQASATPVTAANRSPLKQLERELEHVEPQQLFQMNQDHHTGACCTDAAIASSIY